MSALMRKDLLDNVGGFKNFGPYVAEDFFFAQSIMDQGYKSVISSQPAWQNSGDCSVDKFQKRITRWIKLRTAMVPFATYILEPISECVVLGILAACATKFLFRVNPAVFFVAHILTWCFLDYNLLMIIQNKPLPFTRTQFLVKWLEREFKALYIFLQALWNPTIVWRGKTFRLRWGGQAEPVNRNTTLRTSFQCLFSWVFAKLCFFNPFRPTSRVINRHISKISAVKTSAFQRLSSQG